MYVLRVSEGKIYIYIYTSEKSVQLGVQKRNSVQRESVVTESVKRQR